VLPDYPQFKDLFKRFCDRELQARSEARMGRLYQEIRKRRQFEGDKSQIQRPDEEAPDQTEYNTSQGAFSFRLDEIPTLTIDELIRRIDTVAEDMASSFSRGMFSSMDRTLEKYDRVMKLGPPSPEALLTMISNSEVSFDDDGPRFTIVVPPSLLEKAQEAGARLMNDPELNKRYTEVMAQKWEEWRAREIDRGLDG
jgi:hypothetical protein